MRPVPTMPTVLPWRSKPSRPWSSKLPSRDPVVGAVGLAVEGQDQRDRVLGDGVGRVGGHPADGEARRGGRRDVDVVEAGRAEGEQADAEGGEARDDRRREVVVDEGANRPGPGREGGGVGGEAGLVEDEHVARGGIGGGQRSDVVGTGREDGDLHRALPVGCETGGDRAPARGRGQRRRLLRSGLPPGSPPSPVPDRVRRRRPCPGARPRRVDHKSPTAPRPGRRGRCRPLGGARGRVRSTGRCTPSRHGRRSGSRRRRSRRRGVTGPSISPPRPASGPTSPRRRSATCCAIRPSCSAARRGRSPARTGASATRAGRSRRSASGARLSSSSRSGGARRPPASTASPGATRRSSPSPPANPRRLLAGELRPAHPIPRSSSAPAGRAGGTSSRARAIGSRTRFCSSPARRRRAEGFAVGRDPWR